MIILDRKVAATGPSKGKNRQQDMTLQYIADFHLQKYFCGFFRGSIQHLVKTVLSFFRGPDAGQTTRRHFGN